MCEGMFDGCTSLKELDLSAFNLQGARKVEGMFNGCISLEKLVLSDKINITQEMRLPARDLTHDCYGWAKEDNPSYTITGRDEFATLSGEGTYIRNKK
jgi:hypothetical protein